LSATTSSITATVSSVTAATDRAGVEIDGVLGLVCPLGALLSTLWTFIYDTTARWGPSRNSMRSSAPFAGLVVTESFV
jgi:hypothetical protein